MIPGMWLDASSWEAVVPVLEQAGHRPRALTLPGMESKDADRAAIAYAAIDARPERVARAVYVGGFPVGDGDVLAGGFAAAGGEIPLPDWSEFGGATLREWIGDGEALVREFPKIADVTYVDLPTGHWPQFTRPADLGWAIAASV